MALKKVKRKAISQDPKVMLLYGAPKVVKTTALSQLDNCLILDTEQGANMLDGYIEQVNTREDLIVILKQQIYLKLRTLHVNHSSLTLNIQS